MTARAVTNLTPADVDAWVSRLGGNLGRAADSIGVSRETLRLLRTGQQPVTVTLERAMAAAEARLPRVGTPSPK